MTTIDDVLTFWFGDPTQEDTSYKARRRIWFQKSPAVDTEIRDRFLSVYEAAVAGAYDHWQGTASGCLALILVCDQFPRHLFRGHSRAFEADTKARALAQRAIAKGMDQELPPVQRIFIYLPLEHSEHIRDQNQSVELFRHLVEAYPELTRTYEYALRHQQVIERFGRFPHRNLALGRDTTSAEEEFLKQPQSSF